MRRSAVLLAALATLMAMASPALADRTENLNHPSYWGEDCFKISGDFDATYWVADADYRLVVVKGGPDRMKHYDVAAGDELYAPINPNRKRLAYYGVSHVIKCGYDDPYDDPYDPGNDDPSTPLPVEDPEIPEFPNRARSWGDNCLKLEGDFDAKYWIADANYELVVVKGGPTRVVYTDVSEGDWLYAPINPKRKRLVSYGVSHVIMCDGGYDDPYDPPPPDDPYGG